MSENEKYLIKVIEERNQFILDIFSSNEYMKFHKYLMFKELLKKRKYLEIVKRVFFKKNIHKIMNGNQKNHPNSYSTISELKIKRKNKIAVYTCITGGYDMLSNINLKESDCDYICFTDDLSKIKENKNWNVQLINKSIINKFSSSTLLNRYVKFHPNDFFSSQNYDYSIYIDGNIEINSILSDLTNNINNDIGLAFHKHNCRNCVYDEASICMEIGKGNKELIGNLIKKYSKENMPRNYGLLECNVIVTNLNNKNAINILNEWSNVFFESNCYRDQIILPYVLWKNKIKVEEIATLGENVRNNPKFRFINHNREEV